MKIPDKLYDILKWVVIIVLPAIAPGMDPDAFLAHLVEVMETASDKLLVETVEANPHLVLPPTAVQRLAELKARPA